MTTATLPRRLDVPTEPPDSGRDECSAMAAVRALLYPTLTGAEKASLRDTLVDCGYSIDVADGVLETIQETRDESWEVAAAVYDRAEDIVAATLRED